MNAFFQKNGTFLLSFAIGLILILIFFKPQLQGYAVKQHDVKEWKGMSNETDLYRAETGEEAMWTSSAFGGMPTEQISMAYPGNWFKTIMNKYFKVIPNPVGTILLHFLCFLLFVRLLKINVWIGLLGAIAFSFSSYELIVIQAGHNTKSIAVAFLPAILGAFIYAFRSKRMLGLALFGILLSFQMAANHLQITYYFLFVLLFLGIYFLIEAIKKGTIKPFLITAVGIIGMSLLAGLVNSGNIVVTNDYTKHTIRGQNDLTIDPTGELSKVQSTGLNRDYITQWSYGIGETFTLLSPYVKGGASERISDSPFNDDLESSDLSSAEINAVANGYSYWGNQPVTSGPVYIGVVVLFLAVLGLFFLRDAIKWPLFAITVLAIMLSWGKNFMGLTNFFIDYIPGYNKFRAVTIILIIVETTIPVLGVLFLNQFIKERERIIAEKKKLFLVAGGFILFLIFVRIIGLGDGYTNSMESQQYNGIGEMYTEQILAMDPAAVQQQFGFDNQNPQQVQQFVDAQVDNVLRSFETVKNFRKDIFASSMHRSILFSLAVFALLFAFVKIEKQQTASTVLIGGLIFLTVLDLVPVGYNYLGTKEDVQGTGYKYWEEKAKADFPIAANKADLEIMQYELDQNPALKATIQTAENRAKSIADEKDLDGISKANLINSYRFHALKLATNYRVFDFSGGFSSSRASYFHKSVGGYHGAKLRSIQNLMDFQLSKTNNKVFDMLNIKYLIQRTKKTTPSGEFEIDTAIVNYTAMGSAWLVKNIKTFETPNDEIRALGNRFKLENRGNGQLLVNRIAQKDAFVYGGETLQYFIPGTDTIPVQLATGLSKGQEGLMVMDAYGRTNLIPLQTLQMDTANSFTQLVYFKVDDSFEPREEALVLKSEASKLTATNYTGTGKISLVDFKPNKLVYDADVSGKQLAVFSELYYPVGWKAFVDGKEQPIVKVNYLLRGLELSNGKHKIEFKYDLPKYHTYDNLAMLGCIAILLLFGASIYVELKTKKQHDN